MRCALRALLVAALMVWPIGPAETAPQTVVISGGTGGPPPPQASGDGLIVGRVVDGATGRPVAGALVSLGGAAPSSAPPAGAVVIPGGQAGQPLVATDGDGRFLFRDLAEGRYSLTAQAPEYLRGAHGSRSPEGAPGTIRLGRAEARTDIEIPVWKAAAVSGTVRDERGDPVVEVQVRLLRRAMVRGRPGFTMAGTYQTDDRGMYRVGNLAPGEYVVLVPSMLTTMPASVADGYLASIDAGSPANRPVAGVNLAAAGGLAVGNQRVAADYGRALTPAPGTGDRFAVYANAFHPAALEPQLASVVSLGSGEERTGIDVHTTLLPSFSIGGLVAGPAGAVPNATVRLVPAYLSQLAADGGFFSVMTSTDGAGRFTIVGAPPGDYALRVAQDSSSLGPTVVRGGDGVFMMMDGGGPVSADPTTLSGELRVAVHDRDLDGLVVNVTAGATVSGRIEFVGRTKPPSPADVARVIVGLTRSDGQFLQGATRAQVEPNGTFSTRQYPQGPYQLMASVPAAGWFLRSVRIGGREMVDRVFDLSGDLTDVVIIFADTMGEVIGTARPSSGSVTNVSGTVLVFPADHREWIETGMAPRRARRVDVMANGTFEVQNLPPGEYLAAAVTTDAPVDLQNPADVDALARIASPVSVTDTQPARVSLTITRLR